MDGWVSHPGGSGVVSPARPEDAPADPLAPLRVKCDDAPNDEDGRARRPSRWLTQARRWLAPAVLSALLLCALALSCTHADRIGGAVAATLRWLRALGPRAPLMLFSLQVGTMLLVMPTWPLWLCGGAACTLLWGQVAGLGVAFATLGGGVWLGSVGAFLIGRYALRPCIVEWAARHPFLRAIDVAVEQRGLRLCWLLKLSPLMHTSLCNYALAATSIRLRHFALACPGTFLSMSMWIFAGASLSSLAALQQPAAGSPTAELRGAISPRLRALMSALSALGCGLALAALVIVSRTARKVYAELLEGGGVGAQRNPPTCPG
ncbi:hypothetical protein KFE25_010805 [Diacronema lutheri]|uniref:VTT domain-containing protein n=1 Tax=Diacronema lutheri TaxID=2081491 RepID=A0A8J5XL00_DIALT|nr:hypothetical protein KFE25_010805 [Diacronema lutheri]